MFRHIFFSLEVKRNVISNKHGTYELPQKLQILGKSQNLIEL